MVIWCCNITHSGSADGMCGDEQEGAQFLPPEKMNRAVSFGKYPLERTVHPPTFWQSVVTGEPYRVRAMWLETMENRIKMRAKLFDGIAPDVISAQHAWWFPEEGPPEYGWKKSNINLLFGDTAGYDPETGSECLRSSLCKVYKARLATDPPARKSLGGAGRAQKSACP